MEEKDGDEVKKEKEKGMTKRRNGVEEQEKRRRKKKEEGRGEEGRPDLSFLLAKTATFAPASARALATAAPMPLDAPVTIAT